MKNNNRKIVPILAFFLLIVAGCASTQGDPLRNTKKLVAEGHASLYKNGAFEVPNTSIRLIPAGPDTFKLAGELMGIRAQESFQRSIKNAADSVYIVSEGTKLTYRMATGVHKETAAVADHINRFSRTNSTLLVSRSSALGTAIIGKSWDISKSMYQSKEQTGDAIIGGADKAGKVIRGVGTELGKDVAKLSLGVAKVISSSGTSRAKQTFSFAGKSFVKGYALVPSRMKVRGKAIGKRMSEANPVNAMKEDNNLRKQWSQHSLDLLSGTFQDYTKNVSGSFEKAGKELGGKYKTTGISLSILKSIRWLLKGILWDATVKPAANITAACIGYIGTNVVVYPTMVVVREGVATTKLALEVTWDTAKTGYDIVAPTGVAALAGVIGLVDYTGSQALAGTTVVTGGALGYTEAGLSQIAGVTVQGGGYAAGKGAQYLGIPLASAGITLTGGTCGTAVAAAGGATGGTLFVTGEAGSAATKVFGNVIAGTTLVSGTAISTAGGVGYGVYELSKAVVVPAGYELAGGVILSYETLAQLSAQSILAVSDCTYMVLSLEGPRWVLYAVKEKVDDGADLPTGAVVDLEKLQDQGEEIKYLPVTDVEMSRVVHSVHENLPEQKDGGEE
ncbi:MAG TPA: hypothetical protein DCO77_05735 [Nitrospiraceae bacterium]|nr:hypothetical protein [Nitrospiraceae bacterium]